MEMVRKWTCVLWAALLVSMAVPAAGQSLAQAAALARKGPAIAPEFRADIERLMEITGVSRMATQMATTVADAFLSSLQESNPSVPPRVIQVVRDVLTTEFSNAFNGQEMKGQQVSLYAKYFTHEEVKGLIAFNESELGKKAISVMPNLTREGAAIGERWGDANMPRVLQVMEKRLKAEGLMPADASLR
jgi:uncharacterized protein